MHTDRRLISYCHGERNTGSKCVLRYLNLSVVCCCCCHLPTLNQGKYDQEAVIVVTPCSNSNSNISKALEPSIVKQQECSPKKHQQQQQQQQQPQPQQQQQQHYHHYYHHREWMRSHHMCIVSKGQSIATTFRSMEFGAKSFCLML